MGVQVVGIAAVAEQSFRETAGLESFPQGGQQGLFAGIAALPAAADDLRQRKRRKGHHFQLQAARRRPVERGAAFRFGHMGPAGVQGEEGDSFPLQGQAEEAAVHAAGERHGQRRSRPGAGRQTLVQPLCGGGRRGGQGRPVPGYHVRRTLAPRRAISSLH